MIAFKCIKSHFPYSAEKLMSFFFVKLLSFDYRKWRTQIREPQNVDY